MSLKVDEPSRRGGAGRAVYKEGQSEMQALNMEQGSNAKECRWPLETGKGKELASPLEPQEKDSSAGDLIFSQ